MKRVFFFVFFANGTNGKQHQIYWQSGLYLGATPILNLKTEQLGLRNFSILVTVTLTLISRGQTQSHSMSYYKLNIS
jgi:hypothetical protein